MSGRHLAVVSAALEAIASSDRGAAEKLFDPEAEWHNTSAFPGERVWKGPRAIVAFWQTLMEDFDEGGREIEQYAEGDDLGGRWCSLLGTGKRSGAPLDVRWAAICELRDQRVRRVDVYGSHARALQAVKSRR